MCCNSNCKDGGKCVCLCAKIGKWILVIGGLNWGLVGLGMLFGSMSSWNLVGMIFGSMPMIEAIVYLLVGISAVMHVLGCKCKTCKGGVCVADAKVDASKPKGGQM